MHTISTFQVITVVLFLGTMLGLLVLIKRHKEPLTRALHAERRAQIVSDLRLGVQERLQIVRIDTIDYVVITGKGVQPVLHALPPQAATSVDQDNATTSPAPQPAPQLAGARP